ncbi:MAG: hypothetical protein Q9196_001999 [Gyalolechia fulgens]
MDADHRLGAIDISQDNSQEVREDTAELASWALSDKISLSSGHSPAKRPLAAAAPSTKSSNHVEMDRDQSQHHHLSEASPRPDVIPEVSEPASPSSLPSSRKSPGMSALTQMFKHTLSSEEESQSILDDHQPMNGSGIEPVTVEQAIISQPTERTALLLNKQVYGSNNPNADNVDDDIEGQKSRHKITAFRNNGEVWKTALRHGRSATSRFLHPKTWNSKAVWEQVLLKPAGYIPPVILGLLLNILDALSYGMILFPLGQPIFANLGVDGISMFYVSCIVSQLVYSLGGSIFKGGVGSEMVITIPLVDVTVPANSSQIEVVPFFHKMAFLILAKIGDDNPRAVIATTILSYSISSVVTGAVFFLMGTLRKLFEAGTVALWTIPLILAISLFSIKHWVKHPLLDATYFISVIAIFYFFVAAIDKLELPDLRNRGWVFRAPEAGVPFYHFYALYDFEAVNWAALADTIPTMLALTFFGIIHVPINVPALGFTMGEDNVDIDRELKAHGLSNALSGFCGSIQNYLVYTNSVLFVRSGGNSRTAGIMLAVATFGILISGPIIIGYIPIMVVGALIFFLGIDLLREALVDTWGKVHRLEYLTVSSSLRHGTLSTCSLEV